MSFLLKTFAFFVTKLLRIAPPITEKTWAEIKPLQTSIVVQRRRTEARATEGQVVGFT